MYNADDDDILTGYMHAHTRLHHLVVCVSIGLWFQNKGLRLHTNRINEYSAEHKQQRDTFRGNGRHQHKHVHEYTHNKKWRRKMGKKTNRKTTIQTPAMSSDKKQAPIVAGFPRLRRAYSGINSN